MPRPDEAISTTTKLGMAYVIKDLLLETEVSYCQSVDLF